MYYRLFCLQNTGGLNMINQTDKNSFEPYGSIYNGSVDITKHNLTCQEIISSSPKINQLFVFPYEVYIECPPGLSRLLITSSPDMDNVETFPVRHNLKIRPNIYFNLIPLSTPLTWHLITPQTPVQPVELAVPYTYRPVSAPFHVRRILDCWFTSQAEHCRLRKKAHKSYEMLYVYEGSLSVTLRSDMFSLQPHDLILYHADAVDITIDSPCSYLTTIFDINQRKPLHILNQPFHCTSELQQTLWKLLIESFANSYYTKTLMVCYLQESLLLLMQFYEKISHETLLSDTRLPMNDLLSEILAYMNKHIAEPITIEEICHEFYLSRSSLQALFKTHLNSSPKNFLLNIKLQKSKELIRENQYTISEIAYMLGFSSIHYFSRLFKKYFNTTPSAYVKKIAENQNVSKNDMPARE